VESEQDLRRVAGLAGALADVTRLRMLEVLLEGDATVSDLAARLELPQPRVSAHLARLRRDGLVRVTVTGRQRICRVDGPRVHTLLTALGALAPGGAPPRRSAEAERLVRVDAPIRQARRCYDHLAGVAGVGLLDGMLARGWLAPGEADRPGFMLTPAGSAALAVRGVDVTAAAHTRRRFATACLDWTERRPHLGGALGAAILAALQQAQLVVAAAAGRTLRFDGPPGAWLEAPRR